MSTSLSLVLGYLKIQRRKGQYRPKLTPAQMECVRALRQTGMYFKQIAPLFNVSWSAIQRICA